ncbi:hypothetical protein GYMLUDRAFT_770509 [Collybiopsis luxurians FD-317 M1]|uniref:Uncharacterized protein n=1 Tax=Collybiopsis luxurians FD-317 M1 TaxID=944289 RepID=A0A0D0CFZ1_9AGAR|nr:hypothetical protein GYMLUDRAFT_770509 [Collybiopsis luxurians FD-317 M1]
MIFLFKSTYILCGASFFIFFPVVHSWFLVYISSVAEFRSLDIPYSSHFLPSTASADLLSTELSRRALANWRRFSSFLETFLSIKCQLDSLAQLQMSLRAPSSIPFCLYTYLFLYLFWSDSFFPLSLLVPVHSLFHLCLAKPFFSPWCPRYLALLSKSPEFHLSRPHYKVFLPPFLRLLLSRRKSTSHPKKIVPLLYISHVVLLHTVGYLSDLHSSNRGFVTISFVTVVIFFRYG